MLTVLLAGVVTTRFLELVAVPNGTADMLVFHLLDVLRKWGVELHKLVGAGMDGASVMSGQINGVGTQLKKLVPYIVNNHCVAHRTALGVKHACDQVPLLAKTVLPTLTSLFLYYHNSGVRANRLVAIQRELGTLTRHLVKALPVRWLSYNGAVEAVLTEHLALLESLSDDARELNVAEAIGLYSQLQSFNFIASNHMLGDILPVLTKLSMMFQAEDLNFSVIDTEVTGAANEALRQISNPGKRFRDLPKYILSIPAQHEVVCDPQRRRAGPVRYGAPALLDFSSAEIEDRPDVATWIPKETADALSPELKEALRRFDRGVREPFLRAVHENLLGMFPQNKVLTAATTLFHPQHMPQDLETAEVCSRSMWRGKSNVFDMCSA